MLNADIASIEGRAFHEENEGQESEVEEHLFKDSVPARMQISTVRREPGDECSEPKEGGGKNDKSEKALSDLTSPPAVKAAPANDKPETWIEIDDRGPSGEIGPNREATLGIGSGADLNFFSKDQTAIKGPYVKVRTDGDGNVEVKLIINDPKARAAIETSSGTVVLKYAEKNDEGWQKLDVKTDKLAFGGLQFFQFKQERKHAVDILLVSDGLARSINPANKIPIGSAVQGDGQTNGMYLSKHQANLLYKADGVFVEDVGSLVGTVIERPSGIKGQPPEFIEVRPPGGRKSEKPIELKPGDKVWFGIPGNPKTPYVEVSAAKLPKSLGELRTDAAPTKPVAKPVPVLTERELFERELGVKKYDSMFHETFRVTDFVRSKTGQSLAVLEAKYKTAQDNSTTLSLAERDLEANGKKLNAKIYTEISTSARSKRDKLYYNVEDGKFWRVELNDSGMPTKRYEDTNFKLVTGEEIQKFRENAYPAFEGRSKPFRDPGPVKFKVGDLVPVHPTSNSQWRVLRMSGNNAEVLLGTSTKFDPETMREEQYARKTTGEWGSERYDPIDYRTADMTDKDQLYRDRADSTRVIMIRRGETTEYFVRKDLLIANSKTITETMELRGKTSKPPEAAKPEKPRSVNKPRSAENSLGVSEMMSDADVMKGYAKESAKLVKALQSELESGKIDFSDASKRFTEMTQRHMRQAEVQHPRNTQVEFEFRDTTTNPSQPSAYVEWWYKRMGEGEARKAIFNERLKKFCVQNEDGSAGRVLTKDDVPIKKVVLPVEQLRRQPGQLIHNAYLEVLASGQQTFEEAANTELETIGFTYSTQNSVSEKFARVLEQEPALEGELIADRPGYEKNVIDADAEKSKEQLSSETANDQVKRSDRLPRNTAEQLTSKTMVPGQDGVRMEGVKRPDARGAESDFTPEERQELAKKYRKAAESASGEQEKKYYERLADGLESKDLSTRASTESFIKGLCGGKGRAIAYGAGILVLVSAGIGLAALLNHQKKHTKPTEAEFGGPGR